jgi:hypothetical protein
VEAFAGLARAFTADLNKAESRLAGLNSGLSSASLTVQTRLKVEQNN